MSYATELAAASRTPQTILEIGVPSCANHYATTYMQTCRHTENFGGAGWTRSGCTVTDDAARAPDGTLTADLAEFAAVADFIRNGIATDATAAGNGFTGSIFVKSPTVDGTISLIIEDGAASENTEVQKAVSASSWTRISVNRKFTGGATLGVRIKVIRRAGDLAAVYLWGANISENPGNADILYLWPYITRVADAATENHVKASRCLASDAGNGSRCYYSRTTCQDPANYNAGHSYEPEAADGLKRFKFCMQDSALPVGGADIWPILQSVDVAPQKIDTEKAVTETERAKAVLYDVPATWNWNQDMAGVGALTNTGTSSGHFWRRFMRIYRNYANPRAYAKVYAALVASGLTESDFQSRAKYLLTNIAIGGSGTVTLTMTDRLKLLKTKAPAKISESNLLNGAINSAVTSVVVDDASELTALAVNGTDYIVTIMVDSEFMNVTGIDLDTNTLTVQRGRWGSSAASHANDANWKEVLMFGTEHSTPASTPLGKNPIDIVIELLYRAGLTEDEIDIATLHDERDTWLSGSVVGNVDTGVTFKRAGTTIDVGNGGITGQQEIEKFLKQIRQVTMLDLWVGEDQIVTGRVFAPARPDVTLVELTDNADILKDSLTVDDNEESRITRAIIGYDLASGKNGDDIRDFSRYIANVGADEEATEYFGDERTLAFGSPWIRAGDATTAKRLAKYLFARYRQAPRKVTFDLELRGDTNKCGDFAYLSTAKIQKANGTTDSQRIIALLSKTRKGGRISFEAQDVSDPLGRRYAFIAPNGQPDYDTATADQRRRAYIADSNLTVGTSADSAYYIR